MPTSGFDCSRQATTSHVLHLERFLIYVQQRALTYLDRKGILSGTERTAYITVYIQGVTGGMCETSGVCSLC